MIGSMQMAMMAVQAAFGIGGPVVLFLILRKKYGMRTEAFVIGCLTMLVFGMILESGVHRLVFASSAGSVLNGNILYYALYGAMMAVLFEETGRFIAFHVFMKHLHGDNKNAVMYGAGHGSLEAFMVIGMTGISNIAMSAQINSGNLPEYTGEAKAQFDQAVAVLQNTAASAYLLGMMERVSAVMLQIALSIIVWQTVKQVKGRILYLFLAMLIHFAVDFATVMLSSVIPLAAFELLLLAVSFAVLFLTVRMFYKK